MPRRDGLAGRVCGVSLIAMLSVDAPAMQDGGGTVDAVGGPAERHAVDEAELEALLHRKDVREVVAPEVLLGDPLRHEPRQQAVQPLVARVGRLRKGSVLDPVKVELGVLVQRMRRDQVGRRLR